MLIRSNRNPITLLDQIQTQDYSSANRAECFFIAAMFAYRAIFSSIFENSLPAGNDLAALFPKYITGALASSSVTSSAFLSIPGTYWEVPQSLSLSWRPTKSSYLLSPASCSAITTSLLEVI